MLEDEAVGFIEIQSDLTNGGTLSRFTGWGDVGNLCVIESYRGRGIGRWLVGHASAWLRVGGVKRLLAYAWLEHEDMTAFLAHIGFQELTQTKRGWTRTPARPRNRDGR